jgi:hypothetical protein
MYLSKVFSFHFQETEKKEEFGEEDGKLTLHA